MSKQELLEKVRDRIGRQDWDGIRLEILEDEVRNGAGRWTIPIRAVSRISSITSFYRVLGVLEAALAEEIQASVSLVPDVPDDVLPEFPWPKEKQWQPPLTKKKVISLARERLHHFDLDGVCLEVVPESAARVNGYWHLSVEPNGSLVDRYAYYEALAEVEGDMEEVQEIPIRLHTAYPPVNGDD